MTTNSSFLQKLAVVCFLKTHDLLADIDYDEVVLMIGSHPVTRELMKSMICRCQSAGDLMSMRGMKSVIFSILVQNIRRP